MSIDMERGINGLTICDSRGKEIANQEGVDFLQKPFDVDNLLSMVQKVRQPNMVVQGDFF